MKNALVFTIAALMFAGVAYAAASSPPAPVAPASVSQASLPISACNQFAICDSTQAVFSPGEGSPMPLCPPNQNCNDTLRQIAGEGSPMPLCPPNQNCNDTLRQIAGEGSPMPLCPPKGNCDSKLRPADWQFAAAAIGSRPS